MTSHASGAFPDRYGGDVLSTASPRSHQRRPVPEVPADRDLVVEDGETGWCGAILRCEKSGGMHIVVLEDAHGRTRSFPLGPGFLLEGRPVKLVAPVRRPAGHDRVGTGRSASGSVLAEHSRARVALGSRIWVEGKHDAELVEKIWGHDLRVEGVVVEMLDGADNLAERVAEFAPTPDRRLGVLLDHLVPHSKETRIADSITRDRRYRGLVHVVGHPFIDVWQGIKPATLGLDAWPVVPKGTDFKLGTLKALGLPHRTKEDTGLAWQGFLARVHTYSDLEPALLGRVEELIDFVTVPQA